jgi:mediator of RNA polymerase II transcription subunit 14
VAYFWFTVVLDPAFIPYVNACGGAAWFPHSVSGRLKYGFDENSHVSSNHGR